MAPTTTTIVQAESLWEVLAADPTLSQFTAAVQSAGLTDLLRGLDPEHPQLTVLAPTDEVLAEVAEWPEIQADPDRLERFVLAHLLPGVVPASTLFTPTDPPTEFRTLDDELLVVDPVAETVNGASIVTPDVSAPNGLVSTVDAVLVVPPPAPPPTEPAPPATETPESPLTEPVPAPPVDSPAPDA